MRLLDLSTLRPCSAPRSVGLLLVAVIATLATVVQPLEFDDPTYYVYAWSFLQYPLDPYGGGRMATLVPPLLPYWGAVTMWLFGESIPLVKAGLFPFAVLLTLGIDTLAKRLAA